MAEPGMDSPRGPVMTELRLWKVTTESYIEAATATDALDALDAVSALIQTMRAVEVVDVEPEPEWTRAGTLHDGGWDLDALYARAEAEGAVPWKDAAS